MYLHKIGGSWLSHPFLRNSFLLEDPDDVRRIVEAGIDSVWIDESRGDALQDVEAIGGAPPSEALGAAVTLPGTPGAFGWGGAAGTWFFVDPAEDLAGLFFTHVFGYQFSPLADLSYRFEKMTYEALL